jgi:protocatechuate 3,4-dioxygenase, alpha subunit
MSGPRLGLTAAQTIGPFFEPGLLRADARRNVLAGPATAGERIRIEGRVLDGERAPVPDALVEIWQANAHGRYHHPLDRRDELPLDPAFSGFGRAGTDEAGRFWFETVKPGRVPFDPSDPSRLQAPHVSVTVFARGMLNHAVTRLYFDDEDANDADPVLQRVPADRRSTLVARRELADGNVVYRLDITLQGAGETAFFNL